MKEITLYEANDGRRFEDKASCLLHERENVLNVNVIKRMGAWDNLFRPIRISPKSLMWTEVGTYFFAPDGECKGALNYAFEEQGFVRPFCNDTKDSSRVMWDDMAGKFVDFDEFCEENENKRKQMK